MFELITKVISKIDAFHILLTNYWSVFFRGASFFRRNIAEGSLKNCNLQGCDLRRASLKNIDMSDITCGVSFLRLTMAGIILILSIYIGVSFSQSTLSYLSSNGCEPIDNCTKVMDANILYLFSEKLFIIPLIWSLCYPYLSIIIYGIFLTKLPTKGISLLAESNRWNLLKIMVIAFIPLYLKSFVMALEATLIYYIGLDRKINVWSFYFNGDDVEKLFALIVIFKGIVTLLSLFIALYIVPTFISTGVLLYHTSFEKSKLDGVLLCNAIANNVSFKKAEMSYVNFSSALLNHSDFFGSNLNNTDFQNSALKGSCFANTSLKNVSFINANLENAIFTNANLEDVNFTSANLKNATFTGASIDGAYYKKGDMICHISTIPGLII